MPPSELISVRAFRDKYAGLVRGQKDCGLLNGQAEWSPETREAVANRCKIADDMSFSNAAFVNPTLFHMLRQHREFNEATERELLQQKRDNAAEMERQRQEREDELMHVEYSAAGTHSSNANGVDGLAASANGGGPYGEYEYAADAAQPAASANGDVPADTGGFSNGSMLLAVDATANGTEVVTQSMDVDVSTVEDALARLTSRSKEDMRSNGGGPEEPTDSLEGDKVEAQADGKTDGQADGQADEQENGRADAAAGSDSGDNEYSEDELSDDAYSEYDDEEQTPVQPLRTVPAQNRSTTDPENVTLLTPQTELPVGITEDMLKQAIASSGYARSTDIVVDTRKVARRRVRAEEPAGVSELEGQFRTVRDLLDESTLASLRKANRRMIPPRYRLEVNFMTNRVQPAAAPDATPVADDEVVLSVCFYNTRSSTSKMEEYQVLGSQSLTVLRDAFYCISDFLVSQRDETNENTKDQKVSSSYFFIENTFYNDMRSPSATDYSRVLMEWANDPERQQRKPELRGLQSRLMDGARFLDLSIRLKQPYTFMHQGDCEHVMMFTDLRLLGPKDDQFVEAYPKQTFRTRHMRHKCRMCSAYPAQYVTKNDFHSGMSPCYFCEKCYTPFHFDTGGNKLLEHDAFPYANVNLM
ncbi:hypothetical protein GGF46_004536 [Coemansia sp. RSA 552]|nr:hypothetical protein GGF46_004536 [Coemansia sp. RSA 552]